MSTLEGRACTCGLISTSPPWVARPVVQPSGAGRREASWEEWVQSGSWSSVSSKVTKHIRRNGFGELVQLIRVTKAIQTFEGISVDHWQG